MRRKYQRFLAGYMTVILTLSAYESITVGAGGSFVGRGYKGQCFFNAQY